MKRVIALAIAAAATVMPAATPALAQAGGTVPAGRYEMDPNHSKLIWSLDHLGFSTFYGRFPKFSATLQLDPASPAKSSLEMTIDTTKIDTGVDALSSELGGAPWFDAAKFPTATFQSTSVVPGPGNTAQVTGNLTLHGVTKPVTLSVKLHGMGSNPMSKAPDVGFDGTATIKRSEFGIKQYVPMVSDDVNLIFSGEFHQAK